MEKKLTGTIGEKGGLLERSKRNLGRSQGKGGAHYNAPYLKGGAEKKGSGERMSSRLAIKGGTDKGLGNATRKTQGQGDPGEKDLALMSKEGKKGGRKMGASNRLKGK